MFDTLQEHLDHEAGAFANEHQAAFALSRSEFDSGMGAVRKLVAAGRFVVATSGPAYCRFTDAILGARYSVESDHATAEEAGAAAAAIVEAYGGDLYDMRVHVFPEPAVELHAHADDSLDEIPF